MCASPEGRGIALGAAIAAATPMPLQAAERTDWLARLERSRQDCAAFVGAAIERRDRLRGSWPVIAPLPQPPGNQIDDPTLRYGDIVVRADRLVVYRRMPGEHRSPSDFRNVIDEQLDGVHDRELRAIDAVVRLARPTD